MLLISVVGCHYFQVFGSTSNGDDLCVDALCSLPFVPCPLKFKRQKQQQEAAVKAREGFKREDVPEESHQSGSSGCLLNTLIQRLTIRMMLYP